MSGRSRLAIVSTYDRLCGIAAYTRALVPQLEADFDITVFDLDQRRLRSQNKAIQHLGDKEIKEIARQLSGFDFVNIQLEYGTLGRSMHQQLPRLFRLLDAAPFLSVTFHTIARPKHWTVSETLRSFLQRDMRIALSKLRHESHERRLGAVYRRLKRLQAHKPVHLIVHTRADRQFIEDAFGLQNVHDHPLAFHPAEKAARIRAQASRRAFPALNEVPPDAKLIGSFGFLSRQKGIETVIRAVMALPSEFHLLIFGGLHPNSIPEFNSLDPYIESLIATVGNGGRERVHFMGSLTDGEFEIGMAICDAIVLPLSPGLTGGRRPGQARPCEI